MDPPIPAPAIGAVYIIDGKPWSVRTTRGVTVDGRPGAILHDGAGTHRAMTLAELVALTTTRGQHTTHATHTATTARAIPAPTFIPPSPPPIASRAALTALLFAVILALIVTGHWEPLLVGAALILIARAFTRAGSHTHPRSPHSHSRSVHSRSHKKG